MSVQVHGMIGHGQVAHADAHPISLSHDKRGDPGKSAAVHGPQVEIQHGVDARRRAARIDVVRVQQKCEVAIDWHEARILWMGNPQPHHSHRHLRGFIGMRVIHEGPRAPRDELVHERLARFDGGLGESSHTVHAVG